MDSAMHRINIVRFSKSTVKMPIVSYDYFSIFYPIQMNEFIWIVWMYLVLNVLTVHIGVIWMNGIIPESRSTTDIDCTMCTYVQALLLIYMMKITSKMQWIKQPAKINTANQERCCNNNACSLNDVYAVSQNKIHDWAAKMKQMNKKKLHQIRIDCNRSHISKLILSYAHEHNRSIACTLSSYAHTRFRVFPIHWHGSVWARLIYGYTICKL